VYVRPFGEIVHDLASQGSIFPPWPSYTMSSVYCCPIIACGMSPPICGSMQLSCRSSR